MKLGVCYYPEHWPESMWEQDASRMAAMGISVVRIAEFSWSRIEPRAGEFHWDWLDRALECLHRHGLEVVMCTPTATPPKWLIDQYPEVLAVDEHGQQRGFGSRRHYCFSSPVYRQLANRICAQFVQRYGQHPAVVAWQTDNEYGCHDTILSYSTAARAAFRRWLQRRYGEIAQLNQAWGTVFWSQEYNSFDEIDPPVGTVTEAHPAHRLDYRRFASDEVLSFNRLQVDLLREHAPGRDVLHNFMGFFTEFNHYDVARDLDIAGWDSYPLGFTQNFFLTTDEKSRWARIGHPDIPAFHHELYRGMCHGRWWVMEQQPGPVNWAQWNPAPVAGAVRLWSWQAFAHGAEVVSYFRWRQAPFAQEQMHAGLHRPDNTLDAGGVEVTQIGEELKSLSDALAQDGSRPGNKVALMFDYEAQWMAQIQPQGADFSYLELAFRLYSALRQLGLDVDIISPDAALDGYRLLVLPAQMHVTAALATRLHAFDGALVIGPRSASKTASFSVEADLPPGPLAELAGIKVLQVESLPPGVDDAVIGFSGVVTVSRWRENIALKAAVALVTYADGRAAVSLHQRCFYVAGWLDDNGWRQLFLQATQIAAIKTMVLPDTLRITRLGDLCFALNFSDSPLHWQPEGTAVCLLGQALLPPSGVTIWRAVESLPAGS